MERPVMIGGFLTLHAVVCSIAPYMLYTFGLKYVEPGRAAILASCEPVMAAILGSLLYHEFPSLVAILGILLVLGALSLLSSPDRISIQQ